MISALSALIQCDTCYPPGDNYPAFTRLLIDLCRDLDADHECVTVPGDKVATEGVNGERVNLLTRIPVQQQGLPEVLIYFHMDTAPAGAGWTCPPFELTVEGDRLKGRGTADMKGTIVAVLDAIRRLRQAGSTLAYRPILAFCTDEEGGKYPGIRHLAETRSLPAILLNLNGSAENRIWAGCFGSLTLELVCTGRGAHSGTPEQGINALECALPAMTALTQLKQQVEQRTSAMPAPPDSPDPLCAKLTLTAVRAGDMGSAVPGECRVTINRRYLPEESEYAVRDEIHQTLSAALSDSDLLAWTLEEVGHLPPVRDPSGPATDRWTAARAAATGVPMQEFSLYGSTTSSDFGWVQRAGIRHMLLGGLARPASRVHGPDEHTTRQDLVTLSTSIAHFLSADFPESDDEFAIDPVTNDTSAVPSEPCSQS